MHTPKEPSRDSDVIQQAEQIANAALDSKGQPVRTGVLSICDVDLPFLVADGEVYIQTTFPEFFDAVSAAMVDFLRDMEIRISEARGAALAHAHLFPEVHLSRVVEPNVVRDSGEQR